MKRAKQHSSLAAQYGQQDCTRYMIDCGAKVNTVTKEDITALIVAAEKCVTCLIGNTLSGRATLQEYGIVAEGHLLSNVPYLIFSERPARVGAAIN